MWLFIHAGIYGVYLCWRRELRHNSGRYCCHYSDVTLSSWCQKAPAHRLFVQQFVQVENKLNIQNHTTLMAICEGKSIDNRRWESLRHCLPLQWRHNGHDGVSNHRHIDCLCNRLGADHWPIWGEFAGDRLIRASNAKMLPFDDVIMLVFVTLWCRANVCPTSISHPSGFLYRAHGHRNGNEVAQNDDI